jgi:hypothetical protein
MTEKQKPANEKKFMLSLTKNEAFLLTEEILKNTEVFKVEYAEYMKETAELMKKISMLKILHDSDMSDFV